MRGRKPTSPSTSVAHGTARHNRPKIEISVPSSLPQQIDYLLTERGKQVWLDVVGPAASFGASECDSVTLAVFCNLVADIAMCYQAGESPPMAALREARTLAEMFGMAGPASRILRGGGQTPRGGEPNPWHKYREP